MMYFHKIIIYLYIREDRRHILTKMLNNYLITLIYFDKFL